jgi:hypothetical protein
MLACFLVAIATSRPNRPSYSYNFDSCGIFCHAVSRYGANTHFSRQIEKKPTKPPLPHILTDTSDIPSRKKHILMVFIIAQESRFRNEGLALAPLVGRFSGGREASGTVATGGSRGGGGPLLEPGGLPCTPG